MINVRSISFWPFVSFNILMQFYFSLILAFVKRMHAHVRRNLGFDSTFGGLGVLTSVVWQYTFHFESLHFRFLWSLPPVGHGLWLVPAAVWRLDQAALWNMTLHSTRASSPITPRSGDAARHCDWPIFTFFVCLLCLFMPTLVSWSFWYIFAKFAKTRITELLCDLPYDGEYDEEMAVRITGRNEDDWNWN